MLKKNRDLYFERHLARFKALSVQLSWWPNFRSNLYVWFRATTKEDHAGIRFSWHVWHLMFDVSLFDERHWDDEHDTWAVTHDRCDISR